MAAVAASAIALGVDEASSPLSVQDNENPVGSKEYKVGADLGEDENWSDEADSEEDEEIADALDWLDFQDGMREENLSCLLVLWL